MTSEDFRRRNVNIRPRAIADIEKHADYLEEHAPPNVAQRFRSALMFAIDQISRSPFAGAPREAYDHRLPGLRMWVVPDFRNYLIFYLTPADDVEIVRVFHGAQDIADILAQDHE